MNKKPRRKKSEDRFGLKSSDGITTGSVIAFIRQAKRSLSTCWPHVLLCALFPWGAAAEIVTPEGYTISAGELHTCAIDDSGVVCWGNDASNESTVPAGLANPRQVSAGADHTCAFDDNGVICWGGNDYGQSTVPDGVSNPSQIAAGMYHTCVIDDNGVSCWGSDEFGQSTVPAGLVNPTYVTAGMYHTCALDDNGVTCWGDDLYGQSTVPDGLLHPRQVAAGMYHNCVIDDNGVTCWGYDVYGEITVPSGLANPRQIVAGGFHTCALDDNGVICWGDDDYGQSTVPMGLSNPHMITAGSNYTCALNGVDAVCWGRNAYGESTVPYLSFSRFGPPPFIDIDANGSNGPVALYSGAPLDITVELNPGSKAGVSADWWIAARTPVGFYWYVVGRGWIPAKTPQLSLAAPLVDLPRSAVSFWDTSSLPAGSYTFYFIVDENQDGRLGFDHVDKVDVTIRAWR